MKKFLYSLLLKKLYNLLKRQDTEVSVELNDSDEDFVEEENEDNLNENSIVIEL